MRLGVLLSILREIGFQKAETPEWTAADALKGGGTSITLFYESGAYARVSPSRDGYLRLKLFNGEHLCIKTEYFQTASTTEDWMGTVKAVARPEGM